MTAAQRRTQPIDSPQPSAAAEAAPAHAAPTAAVTASAASQATAAVSARQPLVYSYVGNEMRRILMLSGIIIVAIVALSFFL